MNRNKLSLDTDISPIVSPTSEHSNNFMSPHDPIIAGMKFPKVIITPSRHSHQNAAEAQNQMAIRVENQELANSRMNNTNTTNESYSNEKPGSNELLRTIYTDSSRVFLEQDCEAEKLEKSNINRSIRFEPLENIEYEEFIPEKTFSVCSEKNSRETVPNGNKRFSNEIMWEKEAQVVQQPAGRSSQNFDPTAPEFGIREPPAPSRLKNNKGFAFPTGNSQTNNITAGEMLYSRTNQDKIQIIDQLDALEAVIQSEGASAKIDYKPKEEKGQAKNERPEVANERGPFLFSSPTHRKSHSNPNNIEEYYRNNSKLMTNSLLKPPEYSENEERNKKKIQLRHQNVLSSGSLQKSQEGPFQVEGKAGAEAAQTMANTSLLKSNHQKNPSKIIDQVKEKQNFLRSLLEDLELIQNENEKYKFENDKLKRTIEEMRFREGEAGDKDYELISTTPTDSSNKTIAQKRMAQLSSSNNGSSGSNCKACGRSRVSAESSKREAGESVKQGEVREAFKETYISAKATEHVEKEKSAAAAMRESSGPGDGKSNEITIIKQLEREKKILADTILNQRQAILTLEERLNHLSKSNEELKAKVKVLRGSGEQKAGSQKKPPLSTPGEDLEKILTSITNENRTLKSQVAVVNQKLDAQKKIMEEKDRNTESILSKLEMITRSLKEKSQEAADLKYENAKQKNELEALKNELFLKKNNDNFKKNNSAVILGVASPSHENHHDQLKKQNVSGISSQSKEDSAKLYELIKNSKMNINPALKETSPRENLVHQLKTQELGGSLLAKFTDDLKSKKLLEKSSDSSSSQINPSLSQAKPTASKASDTVEARKAEEEDYKKYLSSSTFEKRNFSSSSDNFFSKAKPRATNEKNESFSEMKSVEMKSNHLSMEMLLSMTNHPATTRTKREVEKISNFEKESKGIWEFLHPKQSYNKTSTEDQNAMTKSSAEARQNNLNSGENPGPATAKRAESGRPDVDWKAFLRAQSLTSIKEFQRSAERGGGPLSMNPQVSDRSQKKSWDTGMAKPQKQQGAEALEKLSQQASEEAHLKYMSGKDPKTQISFKAGEALRFFTTRYHSGNPVTKISEKALEFNLKSKN